MDVTLGPWTAAHPENKALAEAMGDEAWKTVQKADGFTPKEAPKGNSPVKGYSVSGRVLSVTKQGSSTHVSVAFTIWVDGTMSNVPPVPGAGFAEGGSTAEDVVRAITEARIEKILATLKTGRVVKAA